MCEREIVCERVCARASGGDTSMPFVNDICMCVYVCMCKKVIVCV